MRSALTLGTLGVLLLFGFGMGLLHWSAEECGRALGITLISGLISPLIILQGERFRILRRSIFRNGYITWVVFVILFFGLIWVFGPEALRSLNAMLWMALPLSLSTGFSIIVFGPVQDSLVRTRQKRQR